MDDYSSRPCVYSRDQARIVDLLLAYRIATSVYTLPTAWRLRLLLSSRVWEPARDARIWKDRSGRLVGFAMLWRRRRDAPYLVLDRFVDPALVTDDLVDALLAWGTRRAETIAAQGTGPFTLYATRLDRAIHPDQRLASYGFVPTAPDPQQHNVYLSRSLRTPLPEASLPAGYAIRPLQSLDELEAYAALYGFATVSSDHRQETFASDEYCHLVAVQPEGVFAAYCEVSICREEWRRSSQRLGWIDYIQTREEKRRQGLGRAMLSASLRHLRAWGAETVMLVTVSTNIPAIKLYSAAGFNSIDVPEAPSYDKRIGAHRGLG